jgi:nucleotide-binding universal stress UspA family protein
MTLSHARSPVVVAVARGGSEAAVRFGAAEATRTRRPLDLVHVAPSGDGWERLLGRDSLWLAREQARPLVGPDTGMRVELLRGSVVPELLHVARAGALVVLERRGRGIRRRLEPSTSAEVAGATDTSTVVVPTDWWDAHRAVVSVGLDPHAADERALRTAMVLARLRPATLQVVVAAGDSETDPALPRLRGQVEDRLERLGGDACDIAVELAPVPATEALLRAAGSSDLLVLGRHHPPTPTGSRLGLIARAVIAQTTCPVLLTPPEHSHAGALAGGADHVPDPGPPVPVG